MKSTIRIARRADVPFIVEFNAAMARETEGIQLESGRLTKGVEAVLLDSSKGVYYVAESDGRLIGQLMITCEWSDWRNATFWWIQSVYVHPDYRNQGVFRDLYRYLENLAKTQGNICGIRLYVEKGNARARKTYESLGMSLSHYDMMSADFLLK